MRERAFTRHGTAIADRLPVALREQLAALTARGAVLDGELVCLTGTAAGPAADFAALGSALSSRRHARELHYVAFDVLEVDGEDLRRRPWRERDQVLRDLVSSAGAGVSVIDTLPVAAGTHAQLLELGFEGSVLKRVDSPYRPGRSRAWLKLKARHVTTGRVRVVAVGDTRRRHALCELAGGRSCWAFAPRARVGEDVTIVYSREDADGALREARVLEGR